MTAKPHGYTCTQEGPIAELKARVTIMDKNATNVAAKMDDILSALHKNNEDNKVQDATLFASFRSIKDMLESEQEARTELSEGQRKIFENVNTIATRVNNIENDVSNIKVDVGATKEAVKANAEGFNRRISNLEKVSHFLYAFGAVVIAITLVIIYANQLAAIILPNKAEVTETQNQNKK